MTEVSRPPSLGAKWGFFVIGLVVGAAAASGGFLVYMEQQRQAQVAALMANPNQLAKDIMNQLPGNPLNAIAPVMKPNAPANDEEAKILELGKEFVSDLETNRLASAYRTMTSIYQTNVDRGAFDANILKVPGLRRLSGALGARDQKVRKNAEEKSYRYYFTGRDTQAPAGKEMVNVALTWVKDGGEWRAREMEIMAENK
jgi:hypothetical protein